jgi:hypothetical protein
MSFSNEPRPAAARKNKGRALTAHMRDQSFRRDNRQYLECFSMETWGEGDSPRLTWGHCQAARRKLRPRPDRRSLPRRK